MLGVAAQRIVHPIRKPRNNADEAIAPKPGGTGLSGRSALSRISSRKAAVAAMRDLFRGSLGGVMPSFELRVNGSAQTITVRDANEPLLYVLRNKLHLTGVKFGCGLAQCGACTVLIDCAPAGSCTLP